jgi:hypothetical protein
MSRTTRCCDGEEIMSKYASELERRLASDDSTLEIAEWFIRSIANDPAISSEVERDFWGDIIDRYLRNKKVSTNFGGTRS